MKKIITLLLVAVFGVMSVSAMACQKAPIRMAERAPTIKVVPALNQGSETTHKEKHEKIIRCVICYALFGICNAGVRRKLPAS